MSILVCLIRLFFYFIFANKSKKIRPSSVSKLSFFGKITPDYITFQYTSISIEKLHLYLGVFNKVRNNVELENCCDDTKVLRWIYENLKLQDFPVRAFFLLRKNNWFFAQFCTRKVFRIVKYVLTPEWYCCLSNKLLSIIIYYRTVL